MNLISVRCHHCGAPLEVPDSARYVTCQFCNSQLGIQRTGSAISTEVLGEIKENTQRMAGDLEIIRLQNEIEKLDREWQMEREKYMVRGKHGHVSEPSAVGGVIGGAFPVIIGIIWMGFTSSTGAPGMLPLFGIIFIAVGLISAVQSISKSNSLGTARTNYEQRRRELEGQLNSRNQ